MNYAVFEVNTKNTSIFIENLINYLLNLHKLKMDIPKLADAFIVNNVINKCSIIKMTSKRQYMGITMYDVHGFQSSVNRRSGLLRATFYVGETFIGLSLTDICAVYAGEKYEYVVVMNNEGCSILKSWF